MITAQSEYHYFVSKNSADQLVSSEANQEACTFSISLRIHSNNENMKMNRLEIRY